MAAKKFGRGAHFNWDNSVSPAENLQKYNVFLGEHSILGKRLCICVQCQPSGLADDRGIRHLIDRAQSTKNWVCKTTANTHASRFGPNDQVDGKTWLTTVDVKMKMHSFFQTASASPCKLFQRGTLQCHAIPDVFVDNECAIPINL